MLPRVFAEYDFESAALFARQRLSAALGASLMTCVPSTYVLAGVCVFAALAADSPRPEAKSTLRTVDFSREVRPILSNHCFRCHGPDDRARKARLRLDVREAATRELPSGSRAIVPGRPDESEMLVRLTTDDEKHAMPPRKQGKSPTCRGDRHTASLDQARRAYTKHWAYIAPVRYPPPEVSDTSWSINPIDHFILARLDREGLRPASPADRYTLLRRASLDLTGLPPTPEEADRFANDSRPDAYERAVDVLLAKPALRRALGGDVARPGSLWRFHGLHPRPAPHDLAAGATG